MEPRVRQLEKIVAQQSYVLWVMMLVLIFVSAALLTLWMGQTKKPDFDHIAVSLSAFQIMFGIAALFGFWTLRGLVKEKAEEVAEREVAKIAPPMITRITSEALETLRQNEPISTSDVDDIVDAIGASGE